MEEADIKLKSGIVLEGGALRSIFSAGVLDCFLEKDFHIPNIVTLSAGAYAALNYVSKQKGRIIKTNVEPLKSKSYVGLKTLLRTGSLFDMDYLFDKVPNELVPFDYERFFASDQHLWMHATNCQTGKAIYYDTFENKERLMEICRASNSMPFIAPIVKIDEMPLLDGGMCDAIPIEKAMELGIEKAVVVFTRNKGYRKKTSRFYMFWMRLIYRKYPELIQIVQNRADHYNATLEIIERLEREKRVLVLRPELPAISNRETNTDKLLKFYDHGYQVAQSRFHEIKQFLADT
ncbi:MAG: patatin family protein [Lachnospiraceae bacterium]|jgi:predicted patatin/cPLA2 family phospholipase|nr:patatin family protein [Lachnospiraceae bacterium]